MKLTDALLVWVTAAVFGMLLLPEWLSLALPLALPLAMALAVAVAIAMAWLIEHLGEPVLEVMPVTTLPEGELPVEIG